MNTKTKIGMITGFPLFVIAAMIIIVFTIIKVLVMRLLKAIGAIDAMIYLTQMTVDRLKKHQFMKMMSKTE